jgi:hypothetical protein
MLKLTLKKSRQKRVSHLPAENAKLMDPQQDDMIPSRRSQTKHEPQVNSSCFATAAEKEAESAFEDRIRFGNASIDFAARAKHSERTRTSLALKLQFSIHRWKSPST